MASLGAGDFKTCEDPYEEEDGHGRKALLETAAQLPPSHWNVCHHTFPNRKNAPSLLLIQNQAI